MLLGAIAVRAGFGQSVSSVGGTGRRAAPEPDPGADHCSGALGTLQNLPGQSQVDRAQDVPDRRCYGVRRKLGNKSRFSALMPNECA